MIVTLRRSDTFIPAWNGNRELPEGDQVKFHHKFLGSSDRKQFVYTKPIKFTQGGDEAANQVGELEIITNGQGIALKTVTEIEGLTVSIEDGGEVAITKVDEFYKYSLTALASELEAYMVECSSVVDSKN